MGKENNRERKILPKRYILLILAAAIFLQAFTQLISWNFKILVLYDFVAYLVTALFGLIPGLVVALVAALLEMVFTSLSVYFLIVTFLSVVALYFLCDHHRLQTWWTFIISTLVLGLIHGLGCTGLNAHLNNGYQVFLWIKDSSPATLITAACMSTLNAFICLVLVRFILNHLPSSFMERMPFDHWIKEEHSFWSMKTYPNQMKVNVKGMTLRVKIITLAVVTTFISGVLLIYASGRIYQNYSYSTYGNIGVRYSRAAKALIHKKDLANILSENGNKLPEYKEMKAHLDEFMNDSEEFVTYLYVYQILPQDNTVPNIRVIYDAGEDGDKYGDIFDTSEEYYDPLRSQLANKEDKNTIGPVVSNGKWGNLMSVYEPIVDKDGNKLAYVGIDINMDEVVKKINELMLKIFCLTSVIFIFFISAIYTCTKYMIVKPIQVLERITTHFKESNFESVNETLTVKTGDELENLYDAIIDTEAVIVQDKNKMTIYLNTLSRLAYRDELTGVKNSTSYEEKVNNLDEKIKSEDIEFAVVMVDMNELKKVNDQYGHEKGNLAIQRMCQTICTIFDHSPVYRIGGDEFVVILQNSDYKNRDILLTELSLYAVDRDFNVPTPWKHVALSYGLAVYNPNIDDTYRDVFNRADKDMYELKQELKSKK